MEKADVCIVTYSPLEKAGVTPLSNLVKIFRAIGAEIYLISGGDVIEYLSFEKGVHVLNVTHKLGSNLLTRIFNHVLMQLKVLSHALSASFRCKIFIVFLGEVLITPLLVSKITGKKLVLMLGITPSKEHFVGEHFLSKLWLTFTDINVRFAYRVIVYSGKIIEDTNLVQYQHKLISAHEHLLDFTKFHIQKNLNERNRIVGYVGRLCEVKGVFNFIKAIILLSKEKIEATFWIGGTGELYTKIERFISDNKLGDQVTLAGWITHDKLPRILNELKLLVLPSYSEGLPNILLEAMACGTPVLATPVGAIPDIIKDGETGFLLKSNNPKHIADKIIELLNKPELLEKVSKNAYNYVRENFSYEKTLESWRKIIREIEAQK
jgi:glycosyltransferase involved in cell wall biosynthesis